jgi:hypothetical protein
MLKFLNKPSNFIQIILLLAAITIIAGGVITNKTHAQNRGWQGSSGSPEQFLIEVEKGNIPGHSIVHKFGHGAVGTTLVPISISLEYRTPTTPVALEFISDDVNDTAAGTGAREITITGIDSNYDEVTQVIATNGTTAVAIPTSLLRLYNWFVSASGAYADSSTGSHVGILTIRVASAGATWSIIEDTPFPAGRAEIAVYTVPDGFRAYILQQDIDVDSTKSVDVVIFKRAGIDVVAAPFTVMKTISHLVGLTRHNTVEFSAPLNGFPARTDMGYMGMVASGTAEVSVHFAILLIKDGY